MKALVSIGSYNFPEPSEYEANTSTIVNSGRNVQGVVVGTVIRDDVAKVTLSWKFLTVSDWAKINKCFAEKYGGKFYNNVTFFNQVTGKWETRKLYVSDRTASIFRRDPISGDVVGYVNPKLSLVEV